MHCWLSTSGMANLLSPCHVQDASRAVLTQSVDFAVASLHLLHLHVWNRTAELWKLQLWNLRVPTFFIPKILKKSPMVSDCLGFCSRMFWVNSSCGNLGLRSATWKTRCWSPWDLRPRPLGLWRPGLASFGTRRRSNGPQKVPGQGQPDFSRKKYGMGKSYI